MIYRSRVYGVLATVFLLKVHTSSRSFPGARTTFAGWLGVARRLFGWGFQ